MSRCHDAFRSRAGPQSPKLAGVHYNRVRMTKIAPGDPQLAVMEGLVRRPELGEADRSLLRIALGKAYEDLGHHDEAFGISSKASAWARLAPYDEAAMAARFEALHRVFTPKLIAAKAGQRLPSELPIFVAGFPRSGTTLVEQILASHPQIHGAGEARLSGPRRGVLPAPRPPGSAFPTIWPNLDAAEFAALGEAYVERLAHPGARAGRTSPTSCPRTT